MFPNPIDIIRERDWEEATFTTFALSLSFFETMVLRELKARGCKSVTILVDAFGYERSLIERQMAHVGQEYRIVPVHLKSGGVFHPKCTYLRGGDGDLLLVGSGNLTFGGYGNNIEFVSVLSPNDDHAAFRRFGEFMFELVSTPNIEVPDISWAQDLVDHINVASEGFTGGDPIRGPHLVHNLETPILDQLDEYVAQLGGCEQINIASPYFDGNKAVDTMCERFACKAVRIAVPQQSGQLTQFPFGLAADLSYSSSAVSARFLDDGSKRNFHAKIIDIECVDGRVVLMGSVNTTSPALCSTKNVEVGLVYVDLNGDEKTVRDFAWEEVETPNEFDNLPWLSNFNQNPLVLYAKLGPDGKLVGQVIGRAVDAGNWPGYINEGMRPVVSLEITIENDGRFKVSADELPDLSFGAPLQLEIELGARRARGWINQDEMLIRNQKHGPIIGTIMRAARGHEDDQDIEAIFEWLANQAREGGGFACPGW